MEAAAVEARGRSRVREKAAEDAAESVAAVAVEEEKFAEEIGSKCHPMFGEIQTLES